MADPILSPDTVTSDDERWRRGFEAHLHAETQTREYRAIVDAIAADRPARVLDWGCGYGQISDMLLRRGLDVASFECRGPGSPDAEVALGHYPEIRAYVSSEPVALPYPDASFDAVLSCGVLEHVQNPGASLDELRRILRPGGRLYVYKLPNRFSWLEALARVLGMYYHGKLPDDKIYTRRSAVALIERHGFAVEESRLANFLPLTVEHELAHRYARAIWRANAALGRVPLLNLLDTNVEVIARSA